jgi:uncharacterized Ntn-hydrolase superfamily protein
MTFSIAARETKSGMFGLGVASSSIAVGNRCPWAKAGVGAILTQHRTDIRMGPLGLDLLARGFSARETVDIMVAGSEHPELRQLAAVDRAGRTAWYDGPGIQSITAACEGEACVSIGNFLSSARVPQAMVEAYEADPALPFAERLLAAVEAGVAAGGETQETMAAALLIVDEHPWPLVDLRVDFAPQPAAALRALWRRYEPLVERFVTQVLRPAELQPLINAPLQV